MSAGKPYFVNAPVDFLLIGGLSLLVFVGFARVPAFAIFSAAALVPVFNWPHFAATNQRLYGSLADARQYPITAAAIPLVVIAGAAAALISPGVVAPVFLKVFLLWSPYHYSGQTRGITLLYARRSGFTLDAWSKVAISAFIYLSFIAPTAAAETSSTGSLYYDVRLPSFGLPLAAATGLRWALIGCAAVALLALARCAFRQRRLPPVMLLVPACAQFVWFVPGGSIPGYRECVPLFHSVQYLLIAWSMQLHGRLASRAPAGAAAVIKETARWALVILALGAVLFALLPSIVGRIAGQPLLAAGVIAAAVQIHHFFVDGVIWKIRNPAVWAGLSGSLSELVGRRQPRPLAAPEVAVQ